MRLSIVLSLLLFCLVAGFAGDAFAQKYEVYGYGGGIFPGSFRDQFDLQKQAIWGGRFGVFATDRLQFEGNLGYMNHFKFKDQDFPLGQDVKSRGLIWDINGTMNFFGSAGSIAKFAPYVTLGVGGITAIIPDENPLFGGDKSAVILLENHPFEEPPVVVPIEPEPEPLPILPEPPPFPSSTALVLDNRDTFFTFNYGGGLKGYRLWGPVGLRADFLGRTMPNFFGNGLTWFEMTGGVTFSFGER
jgi:hypothetical protein